MGLVNVPLIAFNGGEIGQEAIARVDLDVYPTCADIAENVLTGITGYMSKAPGTEVIDYTNAGNPAWLLPFVYNVTQTKDLELTQSTIRMIETDGVAQIEGGLYTIAAAPIDGGSSGGSTITVYGGQNVQFNGLAGGVAVARYNVTLADTTKDATTTFFVRRRRLLLKIGTTVGGEEIYAERAFDPGYYVITYEQLAATYYITVRMEGAGRGLLETLSLLGTGDLQVFTPYQSPQLPGLRYRQKNDVFWLYHPLHRTRVLERYSDTSWGLRDFRPINGPFLVPNVTDTNTVQSSSRIGTATLTAAGKLRFSSADVGRLVEITHNGQLVEDSFTALNEVTEPIRVTGTEFNRLAYAYISGTFVGTVTLQRSVGNTLSWQDVQSWTAPVSPHTINDELDNQIIYYRLKCTAYTSGTINVILLYSQGFTTGVVEITAYSSPTSVEGEVLINLGSTDATADYALGAWSAGEGWPAAGTIWRGRHYIVRGDQFWGSDVNDYESFSTGVEDTSGLSRTLDAGDSSASRWIEVLKRLVVGTAGGLTSVYASQLDEAITPTNANAEMEDDWGAANVQAVRAGKRIVYVSRGGGRLLQALFDGGEFAHMADDLTRLHQDIAGQIADGESDGGFIQIAYQKLPEPRVWALRRDGQIAVMLFGPSEGAYGWHRLTCVGEAGSRYESVCCTPGHREDRITVIARRILNGNTHRLVERFTAEKWYDIAKANRLQASLTYVGAANEGDELDGLDHLLNKEVRVWGDGQDHGAQIVQNFGGGSIGVVLERDVTQRAIVGLNYEGRWRSAKMAYGARMGTAISGEKTINAVGLVIYKTPKGALKYGRDFAAMDGIDALYDGLIMDDPIDAVNEEFNLPFDGATETDSRVCILMDTPAPATVLGIVPHMNLAERG